MPAPLPVLEVDLGPGVRAGFTTRAGGTSLPPWDTLNLGSAVGDDPAHVRANRALVVRWAGAPVAFAAQEHGARVQVVGGRDEPAPGDDGTGTVGPGDAVVTAEAWSAVGVVVADCVPVLLADAGAGVVAAVHAGRRGLVAGVVEAAVRALTDAGARVDRLRAVVGPAISGAAYEVPAALRAEVAALEPATWATTSWGTPALDLPAGVVSRLARAGIGHVERLDLCTFTDDRFYSHRRASAAGTTTGRFAAVVTLTG
ncbi:peptidoglycan editing factor PgeF [Cellulomonas hominis]